jgi:hypothetical protein
VQDERPRLRRGDDDDLFDTTPSVQLRWHAEARLLLNEALVKVPPQERRAAQRRGERQIELLARQQGVIEVTAELVGLALGGMSPTSADDAE